MALALKIIRIFPFRLKPVQKLFSANGSNSSNISKIEHVDKDVSIDYCNLLDASTSTVIGNENVVLSAGSSAAPVQHQLPNGFSYSPIIRGLVPKIEEILAKKMLPFMTMIESQSHQTIPTIQEQSLK